MNWGKKGRQQDVMNFNLNYYISNFRSLSVDNPEISHISILSLNEIFNLTYSASFSYHFVQFPNSTELPFSYLEISIFISLFLSIVIFIFF